MSYRQAISTVKTERGIGPRGAASSKRRTTLPNSPATSAACFSEVAAYQQFAAERGQETQPLVETLRSARDAKIRILRMKELQARIGLGRSAIYYLMDSKSRFWDPLFPKPIKLSASCIGWIEAEVEAWLLGRVEASRYAKAA